MEVQTFCTFSSHPIGWFSLVQDAHANLHACNMTLISDKTYDKFISFRDVMKINRLPPCNFLLTRYAIRLQRLCFLFTFLHQIITELAPVVPLMSPRHSHVNNHESHPDGTVSLQCLRMDAGHCSDKKDLPPGAHFPSSFHLFSLKSTQDLLPYYLL